MRRTVSAAMVYAAWIERLKPQVLEALAEGASSLQEMADIIDLRHPKQIRLRQHDVLGTLRALETSGLVEETDGPGLRWRLVESKKGK